MHQQLEMLSSPIDIGKCKLKNSLAFAPMATCLAD